jgi:hypothetical protein
MLTNVSILRSTVRTKHKPLHSLLSQPSLFVSCENGKRLCVRFRVDFLITVSVKREN